MGASFIVKGQAGGGSGCAHVLQLLWFCVFRGQDI